MILIWLRIPKSRHSITHGAAFPDLQAERTKCSNLKGVMSRLQKRHFDTFLDRKEHLYLYIEFVERRTFFDEACRMRYAGADPADGGGTGGCDRRPVFAPVRAEAQRGEAGGGLEAPHGGAIGGEPRPLWAGPLAHAGHAAARPLMSGRDHAGQLHDADDVHETGACLLCVYCMCVYCMCVYCVFFLLLCLPCLLCVYFVSTLCLPCAHDRRAGPGGYWAGVG